MRGLKGFMGVKAYRVCGLIGSVDFIGLKTNCVS